MDRTLGILKVGACYIIKGINNDTKLVREGDIILEKTQYKIEQVEIFPKKLCRSALAVFYIIPALLICPKHLFKNKSHRI